jgi:hypothetical protein
VEPPSRHYWPRSLFDDPLTVTALFAGRLEETRVAGDTVIVNVLPIGHVGHLGVATNAKGTGGALFDKGHINLLILELGLAEARSEQLGRNRSVLLAEFHLYPFVLAVNDASLAPGLTNNPERQQ